MKNSLYPIIALLFCIIATSSCNDTDDLNAIFLKNEKRMVNVLFHSGGKPKPVIENPTPLEIEHLEEPSNYTLKFDGVVEHDKITNRTYTFKLINSTITGSFNADGKTGRLSMHVPEYAKLSNIESKDRIAQEAFKAIKNATKYSGDVNLFKLHYKDGQSTNKYLMFTPR